MRSPSNKCGARKDRPVPLAERMRPDSLDAFIGQRHLLEKDRLLPRLLASNSLPSLLLWGPPGSGKTTLARLLASRVQADFVSFSAVLSGVADLRRIVAMAEERSDRDDGVASVLFVDEIHRFSKSQQDFFLPHVESGLITLIGATTENPSFQVIAPLLSRCRVLVLERLAEDELERIIQNAVDDVERGLGGSQCAVSPEALRHLVRMADGDGRRALNSLEIAAAMATNVATKDVASGRIDLELAEEACQRQSLRYDQSGEEHYNIISALHKSLRDSDPDGGLYWLARMLGGGEDPLYIARRMVRFASEDIGIADPQALTMALACRDAFLFLGAPEGELALAQSVVYLATAPKSNAVYMALKSAAGEVKRTGALPVPLHMRNAPTKLMRALEYGQGYQYAHDAPEALVQQNHLPEGLEKKRFYKPTNRGYEATVADRLVRWRKILEDREKQTERSKP